MPEEPAAVDETTQPSEPGPEEAPDSPESAPAVDWESDENPYRQRYEDLRPQYDRTQNEHAQLKQFYDNLTNPETQAEVLKALGYELDGGDEDDDLDADEPMTRAEFARFLSEQEAFEAEALKEEEALDSDATFIEAQLAELGKDEIPDQELNAVLALAISNRDEQGRPGVKAAIDLLDEAVKTGFDRYKESKRSAKVEVGTAGEEKVNLADDEARVNLMANMVEAESQD